MVLGRCMTDNKVKTGDVHVLLAGPFPKALGMQGTFGRILENLESSEVFADLVRFIPQRLSLPEDGPLHRRVFIDAARFARSLARGAHVFHLVMQYKRGLYREYPMLKMASLLNILTVMDLRTGALRRTLEQDNNWLQNMMMRDLFKSCSCVLVECRSDARLLEDRYDVTATYIPNVLKEKDFYRIRPARLPPGPDEPIKVVYSGRYLKSKGIMTVLRSLEILSRRGRNVEFHLTGQGNQARVNEAIADCVSSDWPGIRVIDHGWDVPDLLELLASMHIFVLATTNENEGHPSSLTEGMAAGLGLILSSWSNLKGLVPEEGSIIVDPDDPEDVADAIESYIMHPGTLRKAGELNRRHVAQNFLDTIAYQSLRSVYCRARQRAQPF